MPHNNNDSVFTTSGLNKRFKGDKGEVGGKGDSGNDGANAYGPLAINVVNSVLNSYTLTAEDEELTLILTNSTVPNTVIFPPFSEVPMKIGAQVFIAAINIGQTTLVEGVGVNIRTAPGLVLSNENSGMSGVQIAQDDWLIFGDLTT